MSCCFSIIIPVYNVAPYLRECLDSVLTQAFTDWECICVDDGSTDGSGAILDEYAARDGRFRVFHQKNAGPSAARNRGLDEASGEWIWFVDSDDMVKPSALSTFYAIENKADVTFFSMEILHDDGFRRIILLKAIPYSELGEASSQDVLALTKNSLCIDAFGWTWDKIVRRRVISDNGIRFNEHIKFFEDELFALDLFRHAKSFSCLDDVLYLYRIVKGSFSRTGRKDYYSVGKAFAEEVTDAKWKGLRELAFVRAVGFLRQAMGLGQRLRASRQLLMLYRSHGESIEVKGRFAKMAVALSRLPIAVGSTVLAGIELLRSFTHGDRSYIG